VNSSRTSTGTASPFSRCAKERNWSQRPACRLLPWRQGAADPALLLFEKGSLKEALAGFVQAIARHRHFERQIDPPEV
jgi:hypothetical protein